MRQTVDYDALVTSAPVNAQAARDMHARGVPGDSARPDETHRLEDVRNKGVSTLCPQPLFRDLTGLKKGRLTVVGRCDTVNGNGSKWLVRCTCGRYEVRRTKALRPVNPNDRCNECYDLERIRLGLKPPD